MKLSKLVCECFLTTSRPEQARLLFCKGNPIGEVRLLTDRRSSHLFRSYCSYVRSFNEEDALCEVAFTPANAQVHTRTHSHVVFVVKKHKSHWASHVQPHIISLNTSLNPPAVCQIVVSCLNRRNLGRRVAHLCALQARAIFQTRAAFAHHG